MFRNYTELHIQNLEKKMSRAGKLVRSLEDYSIGEKIHYTFLASKACMEVADTSINLFYQKDADTELLQAAITYYEWAIKLLRDIRKEPSLLLESSLAIAEKERDFHHNTRLGLQYTKTLNFYHKRKSKGFYKTIDESNQIADIVNDAHELEPLTKRARKNLPGITEESMNTDDRMETEEEAEFHKPFYRF